MNILHALYHCRTGGGALQVVADLARAARTQGHRVTTLGPEALQTPMLEQFFTGNKLQDGWRLAQRLYQERFDVVHVHDRYCSLLISLIPHAPASLQTNHIAYGTHRHLTRFATYVVGCSEAMDRHHAEFFGLPARRRAVIQNGVNFYPASFEAVQALKNNLPQRVRQRRICLTVARLAQQKGHRFLLEAIARLPLNLRWEWCFVLAGDGELADQLQAQAAQLGLGEELHFLGHTTQVPAWLALAEVFVLPSLYEGLPLSLLEAMAQGLPCIATAVDGNREVLRDQENGLLCPAADGPSLAQTLEVLLTNPAFRQRLGNQAQADYQSYWTFERTWQAYETLYRRLSGASTLETLQLHSFK